MSVNIHGKEYVTVSERLEQAGHDVVDISTEVLQYDPSVVIKATITLKDGRKATGISGANTGKLIEKENPYEVSETSAIGRALGFLGYGITNGIATADEVAHATRPKAKISQAEVDAIEHICDYIDAPQHLISPAEVQWCLNNKGRFAGKVYCFEHQKKFASGLNSYAKGGETS